MNNIPIKYYLEIDSFTLQRCKMIEKLVDEFNNKFSFHFSGFIFIQIIHRGK